MTLEVSLYLFEILFDSGEMDSILFDEALSNSPFGLVKHRISNSFKNMVMFMKLRVW